MRPLPVIALAAVSLTLAACGSSNSTSASSSSSGSGSTGADAANPGASANYNKSLAFAQCMRTHGVPNFPDPKANGGTRLLIQSSPGGTQVNGVSVNGPAFQSALRACQADLPNGGSGPALSVSQREQALKFSACMRSHGVTNFPDPTFSGGGARIQLHAGAGGGLDPNSPAFKSAQAACGRPFGKAGP